MDYRDIKDWAKICAAALTMTALLLGLVFLSAAFQGKIGVKDGAAVAAVAADWAIGDEPRQIIIRGLNEFTNVDSFTNVRIECRQPFQPVVYQDFRSNYWVIRFVRP